ncbi:hypothetical protein [Streptomyces sp. SPB074]|uniref:hypothetical protein n=1 Tax=Streptomyces sp. (strain SPB074) TaxID=465543 RepID=UPI00017F1910|nr:hypothetical protein [Streptomyces sp. SPB074]
MPSPPDDAREPGHEDPVPEDAPTLGTVLAAGAGEAVEAVTVPGGHAVPVRGIGVYDPGETFAARDQILVATGADASSPDAADVLRAAARARAAALVLRRGASGPGAAPARHGGRGAHRAPDPAPPVGGSVPS